MKRLTLLLSFITVAYAINYSIQSQRPNYSPGQEVQDTVFSVSRALTSLKTISSQPHFCGTEAHTQVRHFLIEELTKLGLEVQIQEHEVFGEKWKAGVKAYNILARIKGSTPGKALLLLSHYDSSPSSSYGASDDGSGVVTLLEGLRIFLAQGKMPNNDIIILFSDAEEVGLLGAKAFVQYHPWAKEVGLVVNFEARGSGGPSYMLLETNKGNARFIEEFNKAETTHPVTNSLLYSIYKMLPNDTDLTVFREDADIDGFNFAFIDDFYDYHSALDNYERLDRRTLAHNGSYITGMLHHFTDISLEDLKSDKDYVFFNFPIFGVVYYPFSAVLPSIIVISLVFFLLLFVAFRQNKINSREIGRASLLFIIVLVGSVVLGIFGWKMILLIFPSFNDILHGFPYQGKTLLLLFFSLLIVWIYKVYDRKNKISLPALLVPSIILWLGVNFLIAFKLRGGGFFILVPLIGIVLWFYETFVKEKKYPMLFYTLLFIPVLLIFVPLLVMFPVGLGMKAVVVSLVLGMMIITVFWGWFKQYTPGMKSLFIFIAFIAFINVWMNKSYTTERKKPTGVFYLQDMTSDKAYFAGYADKTDDYTRQYLGEHPQKEGFPVDFYNKFKTHVRLFTETENRKLTPPIIKQYTDTVQGEVRNHLVIQSRRKAHMFYILAADSITLDSSITCNGIPYIPKFTDRKNLMKSHGKLNFLTYWLTPGSDSLHIEYGILHPHWEIYEVKYDLTTHPGFPSKPRAENEMPIPFVINDATIIKVKNP